MKWNLISEAEVTVRRLSVPFVNHTFYGCNKFTGFITCTKDNEMAAMKQCFTVLFGFIETHTEACLNTDSVLFNVHYSCA